MDKSIVGAIKLEKKHEHIIQKSIFVVSIVGVSLVLAALVLGFVPFYGKPMSVFEYLRRITNLLNFFNYGLLHSILNIIFFVFYVTIIIQSIKGITGIANKKNVIFKDEIDIGKVNEALLYAVRTLNYMFVELMSIYCMSYIVVRFTIGRVEIITLAIASLMYLFVNIAYVLYRKRNVAEAIISTISSFILFVSLILFTVLMSGLYVNGAINSLISYIKVFKILDSSPAYIAQLGAATEIVPLVLLSSVGTIRDMAKNCYGENKDLERQGKGILISFIITFVARAAAYTWLVGNGGTNDLIPYLIDGIPFVLFAFVIYQASKHARLTLKDYAPPKPKAPKAAVEEKVAIKKQLNTSDEEREDYRESSSDNYYKDEEYEKPVSYEEEEEPLYEVKEEVKEEDDIDEEELFLKGL